MDSVLSKFAYISNSKNKSETLSNYYRAYLNAAYYLCCCPFRLELIGNGDDDNLSIQPRFKAVGCSPQKFLCFLFSVLHLFWIMKDIRLSRPTQSNNPEMHLFFVEELIGSAYKLCLLKFYWFDKEKFIKIANCLLEFDKLHSPTKEPSVENIFRRRKSFLLSSLYRGNLKLINMIMLFSSGMAILSFVVGKGVVGSASSWTPEYYWARMKSMSNYIFFLGQDDNKSNIDSPTLESFLGFLAAAGLFQWKIISFHCETFILIAALTLRSAVEGFTTRLSTQSAEERKVNLRNAFKFKIAAAVATAQHSICVREEEAVANNEAKFWPEIREHYSALKNLSELINSSFGSFSLCFLLETMLYYAVTFDDIIGEKVPDWRSILILAYFFFHVLFILYFAAGVCYQLNKTFKEWLWVDENRKQFSRGELNVVLNELDSNVVSVKAGNVFSITYTLIANMLGVTVTYFIICVQVKD